MPTSGCYRTTQTGHQLPDAHEHTAGLLTKGGGVSSSLRTQDRTGAAACSPMAASCAVVQR